MDNTDTAIDFKDAPIITLGDDLQGILGINSTDCSIFTDILLRNEEKEEELDREIERLLNASITDDTLDTADTIVPDEIDDTSKDQSVNLDSAAPFKLSNLAVEYESLARSIFVPSPTPVFDETKKFPCSLCPKRFPDQRYLNRHLSKHTNRFTCPHCRKVRI